MAQPYLGEIRIFAGNFAPDAWMFCEGQLLDISEYGSLFDLIGTTYGGDGTSTFALPDLRGRLPIHQGNGFVPGETGGAEEITLTVDQIPAHAHAFQGSTSTASVVSASGNVLGQPTSLDLYRTVPPNTSLATQSIVLAGGGQPHPNVQPYLCVNFIVSLSGDVPSPTGQIGSNGVDPFLAEIRVFAFDVTPTGWARCNGQLLQISQHAALFSLLGTTYGGDGTSTFALPDLQGRVPMHPGEGEGLSPHLLGETGGSETVTLQEDEVPSHRHGFRAQSFLANSKSTTDTALARAVGGSTYASASGSQVSLAAQAVAPAGGSGAHNNLMPYLSLYFNIALQGEDPSQ